MAVGIRLSKVFVPVDDVGATELLVFNPNMKLLLRAWLNVLIEMEIGTLFGCGLAGADFLFDVGVQALVNHM